MDHVDNEQETGVEIAPHEVSAPPKKRSFKKFLITVLILLCGFGVAAAGTYIYLRSSPQVRNIGKDALVVARVDFARLLSKADMPETKKDSMDDNLREALEELNMEALLTDPKSTGLITIKPAYYFLEYDAKQESILNFFVVPIADGVKLAKFVKGITPIDGSDIEVNKKGDIYVLENDNAACAWNKSSLILVMSEKGDSGMLLKRAEKYLNQSKAQSLATNRQFKKALAKGKDIVVWVNTDAVATIAENGFKKAKPRVTELLAQRAEFDLQVKAYDEARLAYDKAMEDYYSSDSMDYFTDFYPPEFSMEYPERNYDEPGNVFEQLLLYSTYRSGGGDAKAVDSFIKSISELKGTSVAAWLSFDKGRISSGVKTNFSPLLISKYKAMYKGLTSVSPLAKYLPKDRLIGIAGYQVNWNEFWKVSGKQISDVFAKEDLAHPNNYAKHLKNLCDGSALATMNLSSGKEKEPFFTVVASIKKNSGALNMLKQLDKDDQYIKSGKTYKSATENAKDAFLLEKDVVIWTSNYSQYKKCDYGLKARDMAKVRSVPAGIFFDIAQLVEEAGDDLGDDAGDIIANISSISMASRSHKGVPDEYFLELKLKERGKNSLNILWETITDNVEVFEKMNTSLKNQREYNKRMKDMGMGAGMDSTMVVDTTAVSDYYPTPATEYDY